MNVNRKNDSMKKILVWGLLAVLGIACYDDLGNYDYNDINDMVLEMPRSVSVTIPKKDSVLVEVKAAVTQLDRKDNANLTYLWKKNLSGVTWTECGTDSVCRVWVYPKNSGQITLRLAVTDTVQNIVTFGETVVNLVAAFNRCGLCCRISVRMPYWDVSMGTVAAGLPYKISMHRKREAGCRVNLCSCRLIICI